MKSAILLAATLAATAALADSPMSAMKGKMKDGLYSYKMEMDMGQMPGMPAGMGKQTMSFEHCLTQKDIEKGELGKRREDRPADCEIKDFKMSGNTASYRMVCKGEGAMTAENTITFIPDGYSMVMKMAMNHDGQKMNMTQNMQAKYLGPCKK